MSRPSDLMAAGVAGKPMAHAASMTMSPYEPSPCHTAQRRPLSSLSPLSRPGQVQVGLWNARARRRGQNAAGLPSLVIYKANSARVEQSQLFVGRASALSHLEKLNTKKGTYFSKNQRLEELLYVSHE